ncbi:NADPH-dependent FMN reductase, partial [Streptomyces xanthochromogenes]|uniref:NADPH-dependent FMN reductase n=1 Tax=Streptomyces xanthochromogenes TaxID=67384 RepID=UPI003485AE7B
VVVRLRAVEQLRLVFAELHAVTVRVTVSFHSAWELFGEDGALLDGTAAEAAAKTLTDQLAWWAGALREARATTPYQA